MYNVYMYNNTGFDAVNIPSSPEVLHENFSHAFEFYNVNLIQNLYLSEIKLEIPFDEATLCDYCEIEDESDDSKNRYYTIEKIEMLAPNVCKFYLLIDAYNSIGGLTHHNEIISCNANRCHPLTTYTATGGFDAGVYTLPEPFKCNEPLIFNSSYFDIKAQGSGYLSLAEFVVFPPETDPNYNPDPYAGTDIQIQSPSNATEKGKANTYGTMVGKYRTNVTTPNGTAEIIDYIVNSSEVLLCVTPAKSNVIVGSKTFETFSSYRNFKVEKIRDFITILRAIGAETGVICAYNIPAIWCEGTNIDSVDPKQSTTIKNKIYQATPGTPTGTITIKGSYCAQRIYNPKAINTSGFNKMVVYSPSSGSTIELDPGQFETRDAETINPEISEQQYINFSDNMVKKIIQPYYIAYSDPRHHGAPILKILNRYINTYTPGDLGDLSDGALTVRGSSWQDIPIVYEGQSGYVLAQKQANAINKEKNAGALGEAVLGAGSMIAGGALIASGVGVPAGVSMITGGIASTIAGVSTYVNNSRLQKEQQELFNQQQNFTYSTINIEENNALRDLTDNTFRVGWYCMQQMDLIRYDKFLTAYGYNVGNAPINRIYFNSRIYFNYIRVNDLQIKADYAPMYMCKLVEEQLKAGVRLWHKAPSAEGYEPSRNLCRILRNE